ncbi:MAG: MFS transporter [Bacilli bacterium]|nr:MFS transporter [Bacilli bacterium]
MEATQAKKPFKLNMKRTMLIGFAFFGILLLWQVYDSWCPTFLSELFAKMAEPNYEMWRSLASQASNAARDAVAAGNYAEAELLAAQATDYIHMCNKVVEDQQYLVGIMMAIDNIAALILLPIFGTLSDKTKTPIGKRMPYILVGTFACAVAFPFIPVLFHANNLAGVIALMAIVVIFAMMYRNPAVALMPDITPKPLRSKANGIINIMGYIGGAFATVVGIVFVLSQYLGSATQHLEYKVGEETVKSASLVIKSQSWAYHNIWAIEGPFLIGSVLMFASAIVLFFTIKENKITEEMKDEMARGELEAEVVDKVEEGKMSKANKIMLILILAAEFFWFMADNGIATFMGNYTVYFLGAESSSNMINTILGGVGSVIGFAIGGIIASKIGRKYTVVSGLALTALSYVLWGVLTFAMLGSIKGSGTFPFWIYIIWFVKGFGMSLVHVNSFPMVVELCPNSKIGKFTGLYYAASMAAQTITPIALGTLLLSESFSWEFLPIYAIACVVASLIIFLFIKNVKSHKTTFKGGLEAIGEADD